jgi:hypothetical protein
VITHPAYAVEPWGIRERLTLVFLDHTIVDMEFNLYGPRIGELATYLARKDRTMYPQPPYFEPLLRHVLHNTVSGQRRLCAARCSAS